MGSGMGYRILSVRFNRERNTMRTYREDKLFDENERLREALKEIADNGVTMGGKTCSFIAVDALKGDDA